MSYRCINCDKGGDGIYQHILPQKFPEKCPKCDYAGDNGVWWYYFQKMHPLTYDDIKLSDGRTLVFKEKLEFDFEIHTTQESLDNYAKAMEAAGLLKDPASLTPEEDELSDKIHDEHELNDIFIAVNEDINFRIFENSMDDLFREVPWTFEVLWKEYVDCLDANPELLTEDAKEYARALRSLVKEVIAP